MNRNEMNYYYDMVIMYNIVKFNCEQTLWNSEIALASVAPV